MKSEDLRRKGRNFANKMYITFQTDFKITPIKIILENSVSLVGLRSTPLFTAFNITKFSIIQFSEILNGLIIRRKKCRNLPLSEISVSQNL